MKSITAANAGKQVALSVGESCAVVLAGNPTTGYRWEVAELDVAAVKPMGEVAYTPASTIPGAGGQFTFPLQAVASGNTRLKLVYRRSFEKETPPAQTFEVTLVVK